VTTDRQMQDSEATAPKLTAYRYDDCNDYRSEIRLMPILTVRNLPEEVHRALRVRAAQHGRSTEAEVRAILEDAVKPEGRVKLGSLLADIGRQAKLTDAELTVFEQRDKTPAEPLKFR
jgi:plasmid stability protein